MVHQVQTIVNRHYKHVGNGTQCTEYSVKATDTSKQSVGIQRIAKGAPTTKTQPTNNKHT